MRKWNRPVSIGERRGFYEVWYFKLNLGSGLPALWLRLTTLHTQDGSKKVAETWGIFFDPAKHPTERIAVKNTYPISDFSFDIASEKVQVSKCFLSPGHTAGEIESGKNNIRWDLRFSANKGGSFDPVPKIFKALRLNKSTVCTPEESIRFNGKFWVNGREYTATDAPGMQGHIYGKQYAHSWAWGHCNLVDASEDFVFEGLTVRLPLLGGLILSPPLSMFYIKFDGLEYKFATIYEALKINSKYSLSGWSFELQLGDMRFEGEIIATLTDFVGVQYEDTDKSNRYCHNSKVSNLLLHVYKSKTLIRTIKATQTCAFELVTSQKLAGVDFLI
ncbi:MAG: hypothetical protein A2Z20_03165 [Bdellovibrionales bacterium RBG_16_40_8]|nr:MAG: hypothetical protein A2Z20_03165 [Bdellovibrionales bacterium RBG_16_40_8]